MFKAFLQYLQYEKVYSPCTIKAYETDLNIFADYMEQQGTPFEPSKTDASQIRGWMMSLMESGKTARTVNRKISALKSFYRFMNKQGILDVNPTQKIIVPKIKKPLPMFFKEKELDHWHDFAPSEDAFDDMRDSLIIEMFYQTGLRLSELINLKDSDVDMNRHTLKVLGKRNKERMVPFGNTLEEEIRNYMALRNREVERLVPNLFVLKNGKPLYPKKVYLIVHKVMSCVSTQQKRSPHVLRHTFATVMLNNGVDINTVKEFLGHANLAATQVYTHTTFEQLKNIYQQAHPRAQKRRIYGNQNASD